MALLMMMTLRMKADRSSSNLIPVLFEDDACVVFNKPANLLVIPAPNKSGKTMVDLVNAQFATVGDYKLHPCHRLDRETSGAILFAKGKGAQKRLMEGFHQNQVKKIYTAFIYGRLDTARGELKSYTVNLERRQGSRYSSRRESILEYEVIRKYRQFSVLIIRPRTGHTNQIRIQLSQIGHPLVGERKYAVAKDYSLKFRRTALHASELSWTPPDSDQQISVCAELPADMKDFLGKNN